MLLIFNLDPVLFNIGELQIRYYSLIFAATCFLGYLLWRNQIVRGGYPKELAERFFLWGFIATIVGGRIGEYLFYRPEKFLTDPASIFYIWRGGLSSHGVMLGLVIALGFFAAHYKLRIIEVYDRFAMSAALGAATVRLGNFFNSEVVGRVADVPWGIQFIRYDGGKAVRHPSQLYECALGIFVLLLLIFADRWSGKENRPEGLLTGLFFTTYCLGRFMLEIYKEPLVLQNSYFTVGQYLSIPPFFFGTAILIWSLLSIQKKKTLARTV
jgi:prolipoprotein diacylglyceryl transferase